MRASLAQLLETADPGTDPGADQDAIWSTRERTTWADLRAVYQHQVQHLRPLAAQRVGLAFVADGQGIATLAALEHLEVDVFLFDSQLSAAQQAAWAHDFALTTVLSSEFVAPGDLVASTLDNDSSATAPSSAASASQGRVTILTSGTTGRPKAVQHTWTGLTRPVRSQHGGSPPRWLLAFRPHLYAGLQVIMQALLNHGTLVVAEPIDGPASIAQLMSDARVEFASATPAYWRRLLMSVPREQWCHVPLQQITLGGEVVDQPLLDRLHELFPRTRIIHIYATTELGRCFSVTDGIAGFPRALLDRPTSDGVELKVVDDQLWVRSANAMARYVATATPADSFATFDEQGWFATGDLVRVEEDRVVFVGRNSDLINVGGNKVAPVTVERVIRQVAGVEDVRVYGQPSSLAGQLVACQLVIRADARPEEVKQQVRAACQAQLDRYQCPRIVELVDRLELNEAGKLSRR